MALAAGRVEVLVAHLHVLALADLVALDDLVGGHGLVVDLAHLDVADAAAVGHVQLVEAQILLGDRRVHAHRRIDEAEGDGAGPDGAGAVCSRHGP